MIKLNEIKSITTLALPLIAAFLAQKGMQFIDTLMMGWIGADALAAGALAISVFFTVLIFCMGTLSSVGIFIASAKGANNDQDIKSSLQHGIYLALLISLPCMITIWFSPHALLALGEDPIVVSNAALLLHGLVWGLPGYVLFMVFREFISAFSLTRVVMFVALGSLPITFFINYLLIYGKYGFPQLGIAGIGYAGAIIMWFMFFCLFVYSKKHALLKQHISFSLFKFNYAKAWDILYIGLPSGLLLILESGMFLAAAILIGYFGVDALAAHQIALQCASIAYSIPFALSMATALQVGHAVGSKNIAQAQRSAFHGLTIGLMLTATIATLFIFAPQKLASLFLSGNEYHFDAINQLAVSFLMIAGLFQCFDGIQAIANGSLRGLKDTLIPMLSSIGCYWILGVGSAYYLAFHTNLGSKGIWYGLTLGIFSISIILILRLLSKLRSHKLVSQQMSVESLSLNANDP